MRRIPIKPNTAFKDTKLIFLEDLPSGSRGGRAIRRVLCLCQCGDKRAFVLSDIYSGGTKTCGKCSFGHVPGIKTRDSVQIDCSLCGNTKTIKESRRRFIVKSGTYYKCKPCTEMLNISLLHMKIKPNRLFFPNGYKFGKLSVIEEINPHFTPGNKKLRKFLLLCECGKETSVLLMHLRSGKIRSCGCITESAPELEIVDFIKSMGVKNIIRNDRKILNGKELDIYLPDKKLAIEFNGLHWHSERTTPNNYHQEKTRACAEKGLFLLHVWEDDWEYKQHLVKTRIIDLMGLTKKGTMARKCERVVLDTKTKNNFLEVNHIQGKCHSSIDLGLTYEGSLRAVMCFKQRSPKVWELVRYATSIKVVGGFSKLLSHFKKAYDWKKIISFADLAWSKGDLYEKTGWEAIGILRPDYKYIVNRVRKHKFGFRHCQLKSKLEKYDPNISEHQNMLDNEIYRIYDCGKVRYKLEVPNEI